MPLDSLIEPSRLDIMAMVRRSLAAHGASLSAVALSAHATAEYQLRATEAGFDVYLSKPVDPQKFAEVVADCARRAR